MASRDGQYSVFVGNLPPTTIQAHFEHIFPDCKMASVRLVRDRETDAFKGYAYVDFEDETSFRTALSTDGAMIEGYRLRVNHAQDRRGGRGGGMGPRGGQRGMGYVNGRGGGGGYNQGRGRPNMGNVGGRYTDRGPRGGMAGRGGQRQSYHPPGIPRDVLMQDRAGDLNSNSSSEDRADRPRLQLKPRTLPLNPEDDRHLSERSKAIFGTGRPREASPAREAETGNSSPHSEN